jgi:hypothetical protein
MPAPLLEHAWRKSTGRFAERSLLTGTILESAIATDDQLAEAESLEGATLPDGTVRE